MKIKKHLLGGIVKINELAKIDFLNDEGSEVLWVKAVEDKEGKCDGCIFFCCELYYQFEKTKKKVGSCKGCEREDGKNIIFKRWVLV